jgi:hypothetical protein
MSASSWITTASAPIAAGFTGDSAIAQFGPAGRVEALATYSATVLNIRDKVLDQANLFLARINGVRLLGFPKTLV